VKCDEKTYGIIAKLETVITTGHIIPIGKKDMACKYCGNHYVKKKGIDHKLDCPVFLIRELARNQEIPWWVLIGLRGV